MPKYQRQQQKQFGETAPTTDIGKFGSLAAGSVAYTKNPELIQQLSNYLDGWSAAVVGQNAPAIEDMNALFYLITYQLSYILQQGIPDWDPKTTYYIGNIVHKNFVLYYANADELLNVDPADSVANEDGNWKVTVPADKSIDADQKLKNGTVTERLMAPDSVNTDQYINGSISKPKLAFPIDDLFQKKEVSTAIDTDGTKIQHYYNLESGKFYELRGILSVSINSNSTGESVGIDIYNNINDQIQGRRIGDRITIEKDNDTVKYFTTHVFQAVNSNLTIYSYISDVQPNTGILGTQSFGVPTQFELIEYQNRQRTTKFDEETP